MQQYSEKVSAAIMQIESAMITLAALPKLDSWAIERSQEHFKIEHLYNTNALEGNTLAYDEVARVTLDMLTISEKPLKCHLEVIDCGHAYDYVQQLAQTQKGFTERDFLQIHFLVLNNFPLHRGVYRDVHVETSGSHVILCEPLYIKEQLLELLRWYDTSTDNPLIKTAEFHIRFVHIHPFRDGNGRTGRLLLNLGLMQAGYLPINIKFTDRLRYMRGLETAQLGGSSEDFILMCLEQQLFQMSQRIEQVQSAVSIQKESLK